jgi:hypothetical protein
MKNIVDFNECHIGSPEAKALISVDVSISTFASLSIALQVFWQNICLAVEVVFLLIDDVPPYCLRLILILFVSGGDHEVVWRYPSYDSISI